MSRPQKSPLGRRIVIPIYGIIVTFVVGTTFSAVLVDLYGSVPTGEAGKLWCVRNIDSLHQALEGRVKQAVATPPKRIAPEERWHRWHDRWVERFDEVEAHCTDSVMRESLTTLKNLGRQYTEAVETVLEARSGTGAKLSDNLSTLRGQ